jgi:hypothetical protein
MALFKGAYSGSLPVYPSYLTRSSSCLAAARSFCALSLSFSRGSYASLIAACAKMNGLAVARGQPQADRDKYRRQKDRSIFRLFYNSFL